MIKSYKGTDKDGKCRGYQYEIGKEYKHQGNIELCDSGFHACQNPLDVFGYYAPDGKNKFYEVEQLGTTKDGNCKTVSNKIKIKAELNLAQMLSVGFAFVMEKVKASKKTANTSGDSAHANTSGNSAHANTSGAESISCAVGIKSQAKAVNGWIILVDWRRDKNKWCINEIYHAKVGGKIKDIEIKSNTWYWLEDAELKERRE